MSDTIIKPSLFFAYNNFVKSYKFLQENFSESLNDHLQKIGNSFPLLKNVGAYYHADYSEDLDTETQLYLASLTYNVCPSLIGDSYPHKETIDSMNYESWNMNDFPSDFWIRKDGFIVDENLKEELTNLSSFFRDHRINVMLHQNFGSNFIIKYDFQEKELVIEDY
jgi:hypothetical protein